MLSVRTPPTAEGGPGMRSADRHALRPAASGSSLLAGIFLLLAQLVLAPAAVAQTAAAGQWLSADGDARIDMFDCQGTLCGRIVWLREPVDTAGRVRRDAVNEDPDLRGRPLLGLQVFAGLLPDGDDEWNNGVVYVPNDGREYRASVTLRDPNTLIVRLYRWLPWLGWLPWMSRTQIWTRVVP